jgi:hypothetical protein
MFAKHPLRSGFRAVAATAIVAAAVMNLATSDHRVEHDGGTIASGSL